MPKKKEKPTATCSHAACRRKFTVQREWQRFCSTECRLAWNYAKRQQILHANGIEKMTTERKPRDGGWKRIGGKDIYVPPGSTAARQRAVEDLL